MGNWGSKRTSKSQPSDVASSYAAQFPSSQQYKSSTSSQQYASSTSSPQYASQTAIQPSPTKPAPLPSPTKPAPLPSPTKPAPQPSVTRPASQHYSTQITSQKNSSNLEPTEVDATCCFPANDYIIHVKEEQMVALEEPPFRAVADKFALRLCPQYSSSKGCSLGQHCRRLHICRLFCEGRCTKTHCNFDHSFTTTHNNRVLSCYQRRRDYSDEMVKDSLLNNLKNRRPKRNVDSVICIHSLMKKCTQEKCSNIHALKPYLWEVKHSNNRWLKLSFEQQDALEYVFSKPSIQKFSLPPLQRRYHNSLKGLYDALGSKVWTAYLSELVLRNGCETLELRRSSTPSDVTYSYGLSTRWIWYWMDENSIWHPYTSGTIGKFYMYALSDQLEYMYHYMQDVSDIEVNFNNRKCNLDLEGKTQRTSYTVGVQEICRRPCSREIAKQQHFYDLWSLVPSGSKFLKEEVFHSTVEFKFVTSMLTSSLPKAVILRIYRVQNEFLWKAYQLKKEELMAKYKKAFLLKEQYLFHGTRHSVIDHICEENFDWRLCGSNVGHLYGKGTYFAKESCLSHGYAEAKNGTYAMFIALVLVGYCTLGHKSMEVPPRNATTGYLYDTTVNSISSEIFVKYNQNEYYPAYIVFYQA